jgi:hypothetical protein
MDLANKPAIPLNPVALSPNGAIGVFQSETDELNQADLAEQELERKRIAAQNAAKAAQGDGYESIFDRFWTDDFSSVPVVGPAASATASGLNSLYTGVNQRYSYATGRLLGQDITTEQALDFTPGQLVDAKLKGVDPLDAQVREVNWGPTNLNVLDENFNINWTSGLIDTTVAWFLDPLVLVGKGAKVARLGTNFGRAGRIAEAVTGAEPGSVAIAGLGTKRFNVVGPKLATMVTNQVDDALLGQVNKASVVADEIVARDYKSLLELTEFQGTWRDMLASVGAGINNKTDALNFLGASAGSPKHIAALKQSRSDLFVEMVRHSAPDQYDILKARLGESEVPRLLDNMLEGVSPDSVVANMRLRDPQFDAAMQALDDAELVGTFASGTTGLESAIRLNEYQFRPLSQWGSNSVVGSQIANAWQRGRVTRRAAQVDKKAIKRARRGGALSGEEAGQLLRGVTETGAAPAAFETVYEISARLPRVAVWSPLVEWVTGSRASGMIDIGGMEVGRSSDELAAALSDSRTLRNDPAFTTEMMNAWGAGSTAKSRYGIVQDIEYKAFTRIFATKLAERNTKKVDELRSQFDKGRITEEELNRQLAARPTSVGEVERMLRESDSFNRDLLDDAYKKIDEARSATISQIRSGRRYLVDDEGKLIRTTPLLRSQLETKLPMMDMRVIDETASILVKYADDLGSAMSKAENSLALRRVAGTLKGAADTYMSLWKAGVLIRLGYTQRNVLEGWLRSFATVGLLPMIGHLGPAVVHGGVNIGRGLRRAVTGGQLRRAEDRAIRELGEMNNVLDTLLLQGVQDAETTALRVQIANQQARLDEIIATRQRIGTKERVDSRTRDFGDMGSYSAFGGAEGSVARELAGMGETNALVLESVSGRARNLRLQEGNYVKVKPTDPQYYDELDQSVTQMRNDPVAMMLLEKRAAALANPNSGIDPVVEVSNWLRSNAGKYYRRDMRISRKNVEGHVAEVDGMILRYLPTDEAIRLAATTEKAGGFAYKAAIEPFTKGYPEMLSAIHGREVASRFNIKTASDIFNVPLNKIFQWIGAKPETALVRHPYYATVWSREFDNMLGVAQRQGTELTEDVLRQIDRSAKAVALRDLKDTLYTIERLSNPAAFFRWIVPFFPAWENSMKVWTKIVIDDPSVAVRASILWNLPNQLGMVVDKEGRPVPSDRWAFLTGSTDRYIRLPSGINKWLMDNVTNGVGVAIPQGSINVVTPGETPFLPGFGPVVQVPIQMFLAGKPDTQAMLRDQLPPEIYNQIAPFGVLSNNWWEGLAPTTAKKMYQFISGESDQMYVGIADSMMKSAFVDWYKAGAPPELMPDVAKIMDNVNGFYKFSVGASLLAPFTFTRQSKYQMQEDFWRQLMADPNMTYQQRVDQFLEKFGEDFLPMIESTSEKAASTLGNTIESYEVIAQNDSLVRTLAQLDPRAIGILTAGTQNGPFDQGVYQYWGTQEVPGTADMFRRRKKPDEMKTDLIMKQAWNVYNKEKALRDDALAQLGLTSIDAKGAEGVKAMWDNFVKVEMSQRFGDTWDVNYQTYTDMTPTYLNAIEIAMADPNFSQSRGQTNLWQNIGVYMNERQMALDAIAQGADSKTVKSMFAEWAAGHRMVSLEFADFYDNFLENDDLAPWLGEAA